MALADGSTLVMLTALGAATLLDRTEVGVVLLSMTSDSILVGMDFLRRFERALVVSRETGVVLMDESVFRDLSSGRRSLRTPADAGADDTPREGSRSRTPPSVGYGEGRGIYQYTTMS